MDCTSVVAVVLKCSTIYCLQNFVKCNIWEKLKHISKKRWGLSEWIQRWKISN